MSPIEGGDGSGPWFFEGPISISKEEIELAKQKRDSVAPEGFSWLMNIPQSELDDYDYLKEGLQSGKVAVITEAFSDKGRIINPTKRMDGIDYNLTLAIYSKDEEE